MISLVDESGVIPTVKMTRDFGITVAELDLGFPRVREDAMDRPGSHGMLDYTSTFGERAVTLRLMLSRELHTDRTITRRSVLDLLTAHMHPSNRGQLLYRTPEDADERMIKFRPARMSFPINAHNRVEVLMSMVGYRGIQESANPVPVTIYPNAISQDVAGRTYPLDYPRDYPAAQPIAGVQETTNLGNIGAWPYVKIFGPVGNPTLVNVTTGKSLAFKNLSIVAGEHLTIDFENRLVLMNDDPNDMRYSHINYETSSWWTIEPGVNELRLQADTSADPANAVFSFRHSWI